MLPDISPSPFWLSIQSPSSQIKHHLNKHHYHHRTSKAAKNDQFSWKFRESQRSRLKQTGNPGNKQATTTATSIPNIKKCFYVFHKSALPKILFFLDFFTHTLLSLYNCDFGTIYMHKNFWGRIELWAAMQHRVSRNQGFQLNFFQKTELQILTKRNRIEHVSATIHWS